MVSKIDLYFAGGEQPAWVSLLYQEGVRHISMSYMGLRRRVKRLDRWRIAEKFPSDVKVFLDSGTYSLNKPGASISVSEAGEIREQYFQFVSDNIHDIEFASEFDANVLGHASVLSARDSFWATLPESKWMPVWHGDYGTNNLVALADQYGRVGVLQDDAGGDLTPILNRMAASTKLHGVAMTKMDMLAEVRWSSVGSTSWLSPSQFGDTIIWTGRELKRYPRDMKETARLRHRTHLDANGFNTELIESDDRTEVLRLSIWSWQKYIDSLGVTPDPVPQAGQSAEQPSGEVGGPPGGVRNGTVATVRDRTLLPVVGFTFGDPDDDTPAEATMTTPAGNLLVCDTCFMKGKCPAYEPGSACAYEIPVELRTPAQLDALAASLLEMQTHRVLRMQMIEQVEGGYADPNLTTEMNRLWKMLQDRQSGKDTFKLTVEAGGQTAAAGVISRVFGREAGDRANAIDPPRTAQDVIGAVGVFEAEVVEE